MRVSQFLFAVALSALPLPALAQGGVVNVYSYREPGLIQPLLDRFTAETGIETNTLFAGDGLIERIAAEGEFSPADVVITVDIGNLANAKDLGITQAIAADTLGRVPEGFRDADGQWVALSLRARVFYASNERVSETALTYEDIAKPEWKGRLCTRSGQHAYNIGLIANRIAHWGLDKTRTWVAALRDNLNHAPTGADRDQVKQIFEGSCDLAIGNTYYMGLMLTNEAEPEQKDWAGSAHIIYPDASGDGTQVNVSGAVIGKYAPNLDNAQKLVAFLLSDEAQHLYASGNYEFPVVPGGRGLRPGEELGCAQGRPDLAGRDRQPPQGSQRAGRRAGLRRRAAAVRGLFPAFTRTPDPSPRGGGEPSRSLCPPLPRAAAVTSPRSSLKGEIEGGGSIAGGGEVLEWLPAFAGMAVQGREAVR